MTHDEARDEILAVVVDAWGATGPVVYTDVPGTVPSGDVVWMRPTLRHAVGGQSTLAGDVGTRRFTYEGTITVQVFCPAGEGLSRAYQLAELVENGLIDHSSSGVWFRNARIREVGNSGAFEQINVLADFVYDKVR